MGFIDINLPLGSTEEQFWARLRKKTSPQARRSIHKGCIRIRRCSLDARNKQQIQWRIRVEIPKPGQSLSPQEGLVAPDLSAFNGSAEGGRPVVLGMGPAGLFTALYLARAGLQPIVVEQGEPVEHRRNAVERFWNTGVLDPNSNAQFGEGGAGTFSDGKLHTGIRSPWIERIFQDLVRAGAPEEILWSSQPHIGTDRLPEVLRTIRQELLERGAEIWFSHRCTRLHQEGEGAVLTLQDVRSGMEKDLRSSAVFVGTGHSARSFYLALAEEGVALEAKPFAVGVRIEHPQDQLNAIQYGEEACAQHPQELPPTSYKLVAHTAGGRAVYSFCMCPGGHVIACSSDPGQVVTNGMSEYARDSAQGNSALLVQISPEDCAVFHRETPPEYDELRFWWEQAQKHPALMPIYFQETLESRAFHLTGESYRAPVLSVGEFLEGENTDIDPWVERFPLSAPSYRPGVEACDFRGIFPSYCIEALQEALRTFGTRMPGFDRAQARLYAVESRSSAPLRILRDPETRRSRSHSCLFPIGEGSGYAGGITSSAVDGVQSAARYCEDLLKQ